MTSLNDIANKWEERTQNSGNKWKQRVDESSGPCAGLEKIQGINSCDIDSTWKDGVSRVSASDFDSDVQGKQNKWMENFKSGVSGNY